MHGVGKPRKINVHGEDRLFSPKRWLTVQLIEATSSHGECKERMYAMYQECPEINE